MPKALAATSYTKVKDSGSAVILVLPVYLREEVQSYRMIVLFTSQSFTSASFSVASGPFSHSLKRMWLNQPTLSKEKLNLNSRCSCIFTFKINTMM